MLAADTVGDETLVNDLVLRTQSTESSAAAVAISDINSVIAYSGYGEGDDAGVYAKVYDDDGEVLASSFLVNTTVAGEQSSASVAVAEDGTFVVVWAGRGAGDKQGIFMRMFDSAGEALTDELLVNTTVAGEQSDPTIAMASDGSFTIGWGGQSTDDASGVYLQRYDADGEKVDSEVLVNTTTEGKQTDIALVYDANDILIASWSSLGQDESGWGVYGQRYDADGELLGEEFAWNTTTEGNQTDIALAAGPDGEVVAVWQSWGQDESGWGIVARSLDADGETYSDEILLNDVTEGQQIDPTIAITEDGEWLVAWTTGTDDGAGWEISAATFDSTGTADVDSFAVNQESSGENSGHQQYASVAIYGGDAIVVWSGYGTSDRSGVYMQGYSVAIEDPVAPDLDAIDDQTASIGTEMQVTVTASDSNSEDTLTFQLDTDNSPEGATIEQTDNNTAVIKWTPTEDYEGTTVSFRVIVIDDGTSPLSDTEDFSVDVEELDLTVDLNGIEVSGTDVEATYIAASGATSILSQAAGILGAESDTLTSLGIKLSEIPDGDAESLAVDTTGTSITASYDSSTGVLTLTGSDSEDNYEAVLRTLTYENTSDDATGTRTITIGAIDSVSTSNVATIELTIGALDMVAVAQAITDSGAVFYGTSWSEESTVQKELFSDGAASLPFVEVTDSDRTLNDVGEVNEIEEYPTWIFADGTRLEGVQSIQVLAAAAGVSLTTSDTPYLAEIEDDTLLIGSPLLVSLDGYDPAGGELTYTVTTDNADVTAELLTGNRSIVIDVEGYGDMVFMLLEEQAQLATERVIDLAMEDFYDGVSFHRVLDGFVIQGGDPDGNGTGGSDLGDFDDQFDADLQHNRSGLLSYAKSSDDTNDSQFFITDGESDSLRNLDFNHTIFGVLVEGADVQDAISSTEVELSSLTGELSLPAYDIIMNDVEVFTDTENAVVMLKAAEGVSGPVEVTVTVTNSLGESYEQTFTVTVEDDTFDDRPFLSEIDDVTTTVNTAVSIQLESTDVEGDPVVYEAYASGSVDYTFDLTEDGLLTVTPPDDFTGTMEIEVRVTRETPTSSTDYDSQFITIEVLAADE